MTIGAPVSVVSGQSAQANGRKAATANPPLPTAGALLTWALCTPTLNRVDVLLLAIGCALAQTRPPSEVIIVDAGDNWQADRARVEQALAPHPAVRLVYLHSPVRSITQQRNLATQAATADILFCLDDDTLMYPDCAETILQVYEADPAQAIAGVTANNDPVSPLAAPEIERKLSGLHDKAKRSGTRNRITRWIWREIFLMDTLRLFVPYDSNRRTTTEDDVTRLGQPDLFPALTMIGFAMTVRRSVALAEPFDPWLLSYSPCEDTDGSYRYSRHGLLVVASKARLHHYEVAAARLNRHRVAALFLLNVAFFTRQHSDDLPHHRQRYFSLARRRVLAEFLKDGLSLRFRFPQLRGTLYALRRAPAIFDHPDARLGEDYQIIQREVLTWS